MTFVHFENRKIGPCYLSFFVFCISVKTSGISSEPTKISLKEVRVSFGPHVETTKLSDMSKRTVYTRCGSGAYILFTAMSKYKFFTVTLLKLFF